MKGFTITCNECGTKINIDKDSTDGAKVKGEIEISSYAIGYGGESALEIKCKCGNIITLEDY
jgi:hypothetical protein